MKMDSKHEFAIQTCMECLRKGITLALWIAGDVPDEDRKEIIDIANERLSQEESFLFGASELCTK